VTSVSPWCRLDVESVARGRAMRGDRIHVGRRVLQLAAELLTLSTSLSAPSNVTYTRLIYRVVL